MFSPEEKHDIAEAVQQILAETNHPELPKGEIPFYLHVDGDESWSWADIVNNGAVTQDGDMKSPTRKHLVELAVPGRCAVVCDWGQTEAIERACLADPKGGWTDAAVALIAYVPHTRTSRVLAMDPQPTKDNANGQESTA